MKKDELVWDHDRDSLGALSEQLRKLRLSNEEYVLVAVGNASDANGCMATVMKGGHKETSIAVHLEDAILLARAKVDAHFEAIKRKASEK